MKLYATLKNERGGKKSTSDDTRIQVELTYKNRIVGTVGLYSVIDKGQDIGYRVIWQDERGFQADREPIREEITAQKIQSETREGVCHCGYPCIYGTDYCERHQIP